MYEMTEITRKMFDRATKLSSVDQAVESLLENGQFRTLGDILRAHSRSDNPKTMLVDGLCAQNPGASREAMDKKVRNWLSGRTQTVAKQDAFALSRILDLSMDQTDLFLKQITGEGIHWRSVEDIVWSYGIVRNLHYPEIQSLLLRAKERVKVPKPKHSTGDVYTAAVEQRIRPLLYGPEEGLLAYLEDAGASLGTFHNTAYRLFTEYLDVLENANADDFMEDHGRVTTRYILEHYLYRKYIPVAKRENTRAQNTFSAIQRSIRANWPDEQTLSKMKSRELDISRKVLIMLFLATDGAEAEAPAEEWSYDDYEDYEDYEDEVLTRDEVFQGVYTRLNQMLRACGYQEMDPRNPFDWVILFCICVEDLWDMELRFQDMLSRLFPDGNQKQ